MSIAGEPYNFTIHRGATEVICFDDIQPNRKPVNYTDVTSATMTFWEVGGSSTAALTLSTATSGLAMTAASGRILATITDEQATALTGDQYVYALELNWTGGAVDRLVDGTMTVLARSEATS